MIMGKLEVIHMLLSRGADIEALNDNEQTPLYFASNKILNKFGFEHK